MTVVNTPAIPTFRTVNFNLAENVRLMRGGRQFFDSLIYLIKSATAEIHIQFYILEEDETGLSILNALSEAARRGVQVHLVLDSFGSSNLGRESIEDLKRAGVNFKWFRPVITFSNMEFGRRMHHKIMAIDERIAVVTGANLANRYNDIGGIPAWLDFALIAEGKVAIQIKERCLQVLERRHRVGRLFDKFRVRPPEGLIKSDKALLKVCVNDWLRGRADIYNGYKRAIVAARNEIFIAGGYFLPGRNLRRSLRQARDRGVEIKVIMTSFSDVALAKEASEYLYRWMLGLGMRIFEWKPNVMHGKVAVADKTWSTVGSFNLNHLSAFESLELNIEVIDGNFSTALSDLLTDISEKECVEILASEYIRRDSALKRFRHWISYIFVRYSFRILNLFSKKPGNY